MYRKKKSLLQVMQERYSNRQICKTQTHPQKSFAKTFVKYNEEMIATVNHHHHMAIRIGNY